jgi:SAM-dependent methyltransferase
LLEVGSGCGALTGLLCKKLRSVVALEYSYQRGLVVAHRYRYFSNLEVVVGGIQEYQDERRFDYVTVIGVLEYAGVFYGGEKPFESFLKRVYDLLKPGGSLLLAIENKIGLKYLAGAPEDHTGRIFESVYNYPYPSQVRTFSKQELTTLLQNAGFANLEWCYPFPDYKLPYVVLSERAIPSKVDSLWKLFSSSTGGFSHKTVLVERWFAKTLAQAGLLGEFSNSFLVIASKTAIPNKLRCIRFSAARYERKPEFRTNLQICTDGDRKYVVKSAEDDRSIHFIQEIARREALVGKFFGDKATVIIGQPNGSTLCYGFKDLPSLDKLIVDAIEKGAPDFGKSLINEYKRFLYSLPSKKCIPRQFMCEFQLPLRGITQPVRCFTIGVCDCVPKNIKVEAQRWYIFDHEWTFDYPVPVDYVLFRGILTLVVDLQFYIQTGASKERPVVLLAGHGENREYIPTSWLEMLQTLTIPVHRLIRWEQQFQNKINIEQRNLRLRLSKNPKVFTHIDICKLPKYRGISRRLTNFLSNMVMSLRLAWYN